MTFSPAFIDLPRGVDLRAWCVIAADQFSASPQYWGQVEACVGDSPSTLRLVVPEVFLPLGDREVEPRVRRVHESMVSYCDGVLETFGPAAVYVERATEFAPRRQSLIVALDLEAYSFSGGEADVMASEATVLERLPAREAVRAGAALELPHVQVLFDDPSGGVFGLLEGERDGLELLYDTELMLGGGSVRGWRIDGDSLLWQRVSAALDALPREPRGFGFIVGDGNHSLAAARSHWLSLRAAGAADDDPARWALVELLNVHDPGLRVEPIHRWVGGIGIGDLQRAVDQHVGSEPVRVEFVSATEVGEVVISRAHPLLVESVDAIIDDLVSRYGLDRTREVEYVHGQSELRDLVGKRGGVGLVLPALDRSSLFDYVASHGAMPKKSFSLGEAREKRYYCECRRLRR